MNFIRQPNYDNSIHTERMLAAAFRIAALMFVFWICVAVKIWMRA